MKNTSYWLDIPYTPRPHLTENITTDVVIIGGGITGVSAAYYCAKAGFKTVLIEKNEIASGSAGKNGGMLVQGLAIDFKDAIQEMGEEKALRIWKNTGIAREDVVNLITEHSIECDFKRLGSCYVGREKSIETIKEEYEARKKHSLEGSILPVHEQFNDSVFKAVLFAEGDSNLHPVKFVRGLAEIAEQFNLSLYENTPALSYDAHSVTTPEGTITATHVILALETYTPDVTDSKTQREMGLVTEPLSDEEFAKLDWKQGGMLWDTGGDYICIRKIGTRLFLNGSVPMNVSDEELIQEGEKILDRLVSYFPKIIREKLIISHIWTGVLLYPDRYIPYITSENGYYALFGNGGMGLTNGPMLGKLIAEHLSGKEIPEVYKKTI